MHSIVSFVFAGLLLLSGALAVVSTRCNPHTASHVDWWSGSTWELLYTCGESAVCRNVDGATACVLIKPPFTSLHARADIDLHSKDTRCNPLNTGEIQRFDSRNWVLHYVCPNRESCKDVNGIGSCEIGKNLYLVPAANETVENISAVPRSSSLPVELCNPNNDTQSLVFDGTALRLDGVCVPPLVCHDLRSLVAATACVDLDRKTLVHPEPASGPVTEGDIKLPTDWWEILDWFHAGDFAPHYEDKDDIQE